MFVVLEPFANIETTGMRSSVGIGRDSVSLSLLKSKGGESGKDKIVAYPPSSLQSAGHRSGTGVISDCSGRIKVGCIS